MRLYVTQSALQDLQDIKSYYESQGVPQTGVRLVTEVLEKIEVLLIEHPDIGRKVPEFDQENIREIIYTPFRIVYLRETSTVTLVRVWRSERLLVLPE